MSSKKMHANEVSTDVSIVRHLLTSQFPQWANLAIKPVLSAGTDNAIFRLGHDMSVLLPRIDWAQAQVDKEHEWMPRLAPHLPLAIPLPLAKGEPDEKYPYNWSVYKWLKGENASIEQLLDPCQTAIELAQFITALQQIDTIGGPLAEEHNLRGVPLKTRDKVTRESIATLKDTIDTNAAFAVWEEALQALEWNNKPVWFHGDLLIGNLLFERGRLSAVIDFGGLGVGDPACDLMIAWSLFSGESRKVFREALKVDDATWARGRGQALSQTVIFIPYYLNTNPIGVGYARKMIKEILA
ncbi:MAG: aminoglycoside phosphotransferase family protein [Xenococcaceae cyanobacterium MO_167.B27]|nr:aminoglycoside phosphotransferase family protein [Xenococcaceae cyanobacterium MO_167.B27]